MVIGIKQLNVKSKESITIKLSKETLQNNNENYHIVIESRNKYGLSLSTLQDILDMYLGNYIIYAQAMFSNRIKKKGFNNYFLDKKGHGIFDKNEVSKLFYDNIAEQYYFVPIQSNSLTSTTFQSVEEIITSTEGFSSGQKASRDHVVAWCESPWDYLVLIHTKLDRYYGSINKLRTLLEYIINKGIY